MSNQKYNQKSIRLSDEVYNYINDFRDGENFNQKLENIVLFVIGNEIRLNENIVFLESEVERKRNELRELRDSIHDLQVINDKLCELINIVDRKFLIGGR